MLDRLLFSERALLDEARNNAEFWPPDGASFAERVVEFMERVQRQRAAPAAPSIEWVKDRHLAWCRGQANETALGFDEWIEQQWAAAGREADRG
jgi:hypothetical protein